MNCCIKKPVIALHSGESLCKNHFTNYFENKVFKTIKQFCLVNKKENLGVALSGGKDSLTVLSILNKLSKQNPNIKVSAIAIDEGIEGYREKTLKKALAFCKKHKINLHIFSFEEAFGVTLNKMLKLVDARPCTICGIFRRYLLNKKSRELKLTKLATGHNLDDECQSILMNQFKNNIGASARLGPKVGVVNDEKFVQRIKPLYLCTEKEVTIYAYVNFLTGSFSECPHVAQSFRAQVRDMINDMEQKFPGTKYSIVNSFLEVLPLLKGQFKDGAIKFCRKCNEPSANDVCNACVYLEKLKKRVEVVR